MKRKSLLWSLTAATVMFFASCNNENIPSVEVKDATVDITIVSTRNSSGTQPAEVNESQINKIEAYTYKPDGILIDYKAVTADNKATLNAQTGSVTIVVVANAAIGSVATLNDLQAKLTGHEFTKSNSTDNTNGFVMSAIQNFTLVEGANPAPIAVRRTVSKFIAPTFNKTGTHLLDLSSVPLAEIQKVFPAFTENDNRNEIVFDYVSFALANGLDKSLLFNNDYPLTVWPSLRADWATAFQLTGGSYPFSVFPFTYLNSEFETVEPDKGKYTTGGVYSNDFIVGNDVPVYVHENFPYPDFVVDNVTGYNPKDVYCFIVKGTLTWESTPVTRYWRINLVKSTTNNPSDDLENYRIFRNGFYKVNVDLVKSLGYGTPKEAEEETPVIPVSGEALVNITVTDAPWDIYVSNTGM